jgi:hypothetical protein
MPEGSEIGRVERFRGTPQEFVDTFEVPMHMRYKYGIKVDPVDAEYEEKPGIVPGVAWPEQIFLDDDLAPGEA